MSQREAHPINAGVQLSDRLGPLRLDLATVQRLHTFTLDGEAPPGHDLSRVKTVEGRECLIETRNEAKAASCLDHGFFDSHALVFLLRSEGGPDLPSVTSLYIVGLASPAVRRLEMTDSNGTIQSLPLTASRAFSADLSRDVVTRQVIPVELAAYDGSNTLLERVTLQPFGRTR
jgi:hypothetical protein